MIYRPLLQTLSEPDALGVHRFHSPVSSDTTHCGEANKMKFVLNFRNAACIWEVLFISTRWRDLAENSQGGWKRQRPKFGLTLKNT